MTVGELKAALAGFPNDTRVVYNDYEGLASPGFDFDTVALYPPDPPASEENDCEQCRISEGRDKPWVILK